MKLALVCEHGGHLTEMLQLMEVFEKYDFFLITNQSPRTVSLPYKKFLISPIGSNPLKLLQSSYDIFKIFMKERPSLIITTGAEIAIPSFIIGKLFFKTHTIFIESWCRIKTRSRSGILLYPISDVFLVQWPELLENYGDRARYQGAVI